MTKDTTVSDAIEHCFGRPFDYYDLNVTQALLRIAEAIGHPESGCDYGGLTSAVSDIADAISEHAESVKALAAAIQRIANGMQE